MIAHDSLHLTQRYAQASDDFALSIDSAMQHKYNIIRVNIRGDALNPCNTFLMDVFPAFAGNGT